MYAVGFTQGYNPMGNDGLQRITHKSPNGIMQELQTMRRVVQEIYIVNDFTQAMCEMTNNQLWIYCMNNYRMYIRGDNITIKY